MANQSLPQSQTHNQNLTAAERARRRYLQAQGENGAGAGDSLRKEWSVRRTGAHGAPAQGSLSERQAPEVQPVGLSPLTGLALSATAMLALELVNAATTFWALDNLMGAAGVLGASFAVLLTVGLAALDTGGIVRLFGPGAERLQGTGLMFTTTAWLLCGTTNAVLTWWAVSAAMSGHASGNAVLTQAQLLDVAPPFLALGLWLMRLLLVAGMTQRGGD